MIDQCTIFTTGDRVQVRPGLLTEDDCLLDEWLKCQRRGRDHFAKHGPGETGFRYHSNFELFADRTLVVHTRSKERRSPDQTQQYVSKIEINLRKILHGQNGMPISSGRDLCAAILIARHAIAHLLVDPQQASSLIPGLTAKCYSYWRKLEIALDIKDPGSAILNQMKYMQTPGIRKPATAYPGSTYLSGTNLQLKAYDKVKEREHNFEKKRNQVTASADKITRLELVIPKGIIPKGFPLDRSSIQRAKFDSTQRLTGFTWEDLRAIHRTYFGGLKGVYYAKAKKGNGYDTGHAAAWAAIAKKYKIPAKEIRAALEEYGGKSKDSARDIEKKILTFMEQTSEVSADTILSDEAYENPPIIGVSGLDGCRFYVEHYGIESIYENAGEVYAVYFGPHPPGKFIPILREDEYWLKSAFTMANRR